MIEKADKYLCNDYAEFTMKGNVIFITYFDEVIADMKVARKMLEDRLSIGDGMPHFVHGDCRGVKYWTRDYRAFFNTQENLQNLIADTIVYSNSYVLNIIIQFYGRFNKPSIPIKICTSEKQALLWLSGFKDFSLDSLYNIQ
jgi:hypothetical protein